MTGVAHIVIAMKPVESGFAENALEHGVAGLNVDGCRVGTADGHGGGSKMSSSGFTLGKHGHYEYDGFVESSLGRWPANVILEACDEVTQAFPETRARGNITPTKRRHSNASWAANGPAIGIGLDGPIDAGDAGSASRFFKQVSEVQVEE